MITEKENIASLVVENHKLIKRIEELENLLNKQEELNKISPEENFHPIYPLSLKTQESSKKSIDKLINTEKGFKAIFDNMQEGYFNVTLDGTILDVNPSTVSIFEYDSIQELKKQNLDAFVEDKNQFKKIVFSALRNNRLKNIQLHLISKHRKNIIVDCNLQLKNDENNRPWAIEGTFRDITSRKKIIDALEKSEELYRNLVDNSIVGIYQSNLKGELIYVNKSLSQLFEYKSQLEMIQQNSNSLYYHKNGRSEFIKALKKNNGKLSNYEVTGITKNKRKLNLLISATLQNKNISGMIVDNTERKKVEENFRINEERLEGLLKLTELTDIPEKELIDYALEEGVRLTGSKYGYLHFINSNQETINLYTWTKATLKECTAAEESHYPISEAGIWTEAFHLRKPVVHNDYKNYAKRKGCPEGHIPIIRHLGVPIFDGKKIIALAGVGNKPTYYDQSDVRQLSLFMNNMWAILKKKKAEQDLKNSEELYRSFVHNFQGIAFRCELDWSPVFFHGAVEELTGYNEKELLERKPDWMSIIHPEDHKSIFNQYPKHIFSQPNFETEREYRIVCKNGDIKWVHDIIHTFTSKENIPLFIQGAVFDVTSRKRAEEKLKKSELKYKHQSQQLEEANNIKELLLDVITHDLRNSTGIISGFADLLLEKNKNNIIYKSIYDASNNLLNVINNASTLSKITFGEEIYKETVDINKLILEAIDEFKPATKFVLMDIEYNDPSPMVVQANPIIIEIFKNYISNALKYAPNSKIIIDKKIADNKVVVCVKDFGKTIPAHMREKIFERKKRLQDNNISKGGGLGLAIVKRIAIAHNAQVWVEPNKPKGNIFYLSLPKNR